MGVVVVNDGVTCSFVLVCGVDAAAVVVDDAVNGANVVLGVAVGEDVVSVDDDVVCCG